MRSFHVEGMTWPAAGRVWGSQTRGCRLTQLAVRSIRAALVLARITALAASRAAALVG